MMFAILGTFALILVAIYMIIISCSMIANGDTFLGSFLLLLFGLPILVPIILVVIVSLQ